MKYEEITILRSGVVFSVVDPPSLAVVTGPYTAEQAKQSRTY